ncbi:MAG: hypothetical protein O2782_04170 [bacterium]|nr:hypothetical protein [bacterium]
MARKIWFLLVAILAPAASVLPAAAQSPPTDLTELNLEEILSLHIRRAGGSPDNSRWSMGYHFVWARFDGNRDGTEDVPLEQVIFRPGEETRTADNFPVVPLEISQRAHLLEIGFAATERLSLRLLIPFISQETDHRSVVPEFESFRISSSGVGDVILSASSPVWNVGSHFLLATAGLSLPAGSIDETGPTPRDATKDTQLPYTMQIGSGTFDVTPGFVYSGGTEALRWGGELRGTLRLGDTDRDYTLGNRLAATVWARRPVTNWFEPSAALVAQRWGRIDGEDVSLRVDAADAPSPFPYPAAVTDPAKFGGTKVVAQIGAVLCLPGYSFDRYTVDLDFGIPAYQNLNGPQPKEIWRIGAGWSWKL